MIKPSYEEVKQYEKDYRYVPLCMEILADDMTPILMLRKLAALDEQYFLLESVEGGNLGRYSFLGYNPKLSVSCKDGVTKVQENGMVRIVPGRPKEAVQSVIDMYRSPHIEGLPQEIDVARYHSLAADRRTMPQELEITAEDEDGEVMAVQHKTYKIYGLQFHPESIMTPLGKEMIANFLTCAD